HQRRVRQRHAALLPGVAEHQRIGVDRVADELYRERVGVDLADAIGPGAFEDESLALSDGELPVGVADESGRRRRVRVERDVGAAGAHDRERRLVRGHDRIAADDEIGHGGADLGRQDGVGAIGDLDVAPGRTALLRQAGGVLRDDALAFEVGGHAEHLPDRDDAGAADPGDDDAPGLFRDRQDRIRRRADARELGSRHAALLRALELAAFDRDEARAKALQARIVLVAGVLVDAALAPELGFDRLDRQAVALYRAIAAAFADKLVDDHAPGRIFHRAALPAPALLGRAGLVVDDDGATRQLAQLLLDAVEVVAVVDSNARGQARPGVVLVVLLGLVGDDDDLLRALGIELARHLGHLQRAVDRLAAGHRHGVVEEDLVGDVDLGRDRLPQMSCPRCLTWLSV